MLDQANGKLRTTVLSIQWHSPDIFELCIANPGIAFVPGDCVALYADKQLSRPYSMASAPHEPLLRFLIRRLPGGKLSNFLASLNPGDSISVSPPFGWFRPGQHTTPEETVFLATGTGIAPYLSYLADLRTPAKIRCFYGVQRQPDAFAAPFLRERCEATVALSRERRTGCHYGRVTDLLGKLVLSPQTHIYLCGLDRMIDDATDWLERHGVDRLQIHQEVFFNVSSDR